MAAGLPCVGLKSCSGINELILDGETGFLTSSSAEDYSTALQKLMESIRSLTLTRRIVAAQRTRDSWIMPFRQNFIGRNEAL